MLTLRRAWPAAQPAARPPADPPSSLHCAESDRQVLRQVRDATWRQARRLGEGARALSGRPPLATSTLATSTLTTSTLATSTLTTSTLATSILATSILATSTVTATSTLTHCLLTHARVLARRATAARRHSPSPLCASGLPRQVHGPLPRRDGAGLADVGGASQAAGDGGAAGTGRARLPIVVSTHTLLVHSIHLLLLTYFADVSVPRLAVFSLITSALPRVRAFFSPRTRPANHNGQPRPARSTRSCSSPCRTPHHRPATSITLLAALAST